MLVSILIPCYNAQPWVAQALESALSQTWAETEVIVVDDGSTDGSLDVIQSFDRRVRWETGPNRGGNPTRNRLLELARGEWLQYLDADDYLLPDKVARQMAFLARHPQTDVVFSPVIQEHHASHGTWRELLPIPEPHDPWVLLALWRLPQTGASLWRKQAVEDVGGWRQDQPCCQEHELYLRLLLAGKQFAFCSDQGAVYRQWGEHTVCKRDKPEVHRRRLEIEQRTEDSLRERGDLTPIRLRAINQARFEIARSVWQYDPDRAGRIIQTVSACEPDFVPAGDAGRLLYRTMFRMLGFHAAERLAKWKRGLFRSNSRDGDPLLRRSNRETPTR